SSRTIPTVPAWGRRRRSPSRRRRPRPGRGSPRNSRMRRIRRSTGAPSTPAVPELPEVEVVRRGLADHVAGRTITGARILSARTSRRFEHGGEALARLVAGRSVTRVARRGKYLWLEFADGPGTARRVPPPGYEGERLSLVVHLG